MMKLIFDVKKDLRAIKAVLTRNGVTGMTLLENETTACYTVEVVVQNETVKPLIVQLSQTLAPEKPCFRLVPLDNVYRIRTGEQSVKAI
ncbi:hypothetical protein [Effusibacillus dendaii]|uniref:Uncharacterized protein n=1 Tax=Effusibacillus dendaii TaxID=2743772 RepID=A0A7I8D524_9BACL|nr:hypothetical protein [Effusibacillus dendaii]BCJ85218.1 hypothetical protein skT53_02030 [Effusibacillus dendaii]